jgi:hypothetical protein
MSSQWRVNVIITIYVGGIRVKGVSNVKESVFSHFADHFRNVNMTCPRDTYLNFCTLSYMEGVTLVKPFCFEEVKATVWDCHNFKCPGPDGVNFVIIKEFLIDMKDDIVRFV